MPLVRALFDLPRPRWCTMKFLVNRAVVRCGYGAEAVPWLIGKLVELLMEVTCDDRKEREGQL